MSIVIAPYYFELIMPSDLIWTPLLVMDFWGGGIDDNESGVNMF